MNDRKKKLFKLIAELQSISQIGLTFAEIDFDKERYQRISEISLDLMAEFSDKSNDDISQIFSLEKGYPTPNIDVRSFVLKDDKVLLVKERSDDLWTLPGGYADVSETPSEAVVRETKEESGYDVHAVKLLALWDKLKHDHPLHWPHIYKCFFHCEILSGEPKENVEISAIDFFDINKLPQLSTPRVTKRQLHRLYQLVMTPGPTVFD
ncbi:MAG: NUDIX hydrolase [Legionellaceae bacterium]|nr:NUDIX hydrolase [Legionellaceae bacterium]